MKKLKEIYNSFSEVMENPRKRAIVIFCMYIIFFLVVILMINVGRSFNNKSETINNTNNSNNNGQVENTLNYKNISKEYEYKADIEIDENDEITKYQITGKNTSTDNSETITKLNKETEEYEATEKPIIINDDFMDLNKIISYVNDKDYEFSTSYKDGTILKNYLVPVKELDETLTSNENIEVNVYELNDTINKIVIETTNFDKIKNSNINSIIYFIEYKSL